MRESRRPLESGRAAVVRAGAGGPGGEGGGAAGAVGAGAASAVMAVSGSGKATACLRT
jgi:hypothetical protein